VVVGAIALTALIATSSWSKGRVAMPEAPLLLLVIPMLLGLVWLKAFLTDVLADRVFTAQNSRRLYRIGWLIIGGAVAKSIAMAVASGGVAPLVFGFLQPSLLSGLLVLVLASAWRYGSELQNERDLTV
jgi:hypothetical protein